MERNLINWNKHLVDFHGGGWPPLCWFVPTDARLTLTLGHLQQLLHLHRGFNFLLFLGLQFILLLLILLLLVFQFVLGPLLQEFLLFLLILKNSYKSMDKFIRTKAQKMKEILNCVGNGSKCTRTAKSISCCFCFFMSLSSICWILKLASNCAFRSSLFCAYRQEKKLFFSQILCINIMLRAFHIGLKKNPLWYLYLTNISIEWNKEVFLLDSPLMPPVLFHVFLSVS